MKQDIFYHTLASTWFVFHGRSNGLPFSHDYNRPARLGMHRLFRVNKKQGSPSNQARIIVGNHRWIALACV